MNEKQRVICMVCGYEAKFYGKDAEEWRVSYYEGPHGRLQILSCPTCTDLEPKRIVDRFLERIRTGENQAFH